MSSLLQAARDLRLLTGNPQSPIIGQSFIHALQKVELAYFSEVNPIDREKLTYLKNIIGTAATELVNDGVVPNSYALKILSKLQAREIIPLPTEQAAPVESIEITPILPREILERKIRTDFHREPVTTIVTSPRTNSEGFFIVRNRGIDDQGRESPTCSITNYLLGNWDESIRRHRPIDAGGNSEVYIAHEEGTPRPVAIKIAAIRHAKDRTFGLNRFKNGKYFQALLGRYFSFKS